MYASITKRMAKLKGSPVVVNWLLVMNEQTNEALKSSLDDALNGVFADDEVGQAYRTFFETPLVVTFFAVLKKAYKEESR